MKKLLLLTLLATIVSVASFAQLPAISGLTSLCLGDTVTLNETGAHPGYFVSSNTGVCNVVYISDFSCIVYGVSPGADTITYYADTGIYGSASITFTVNAMPAAITGTASFCAGATSHLGDATSGGTWSSSNTSVATVGSSGIVTGVSGGTTTIYYSTGGGACAASVPVIIATTTVSPISGVFHVCAGALATITDSSPGGIWSSSNTSIATINPATGLAYGVTAGTATITYTSACTSVYATATLTVNSVLPAAISGYTTICDTGLSGTGEGMTYLYDATSGGTWSSRNTSIATVSSSGVVTGHGIGTDIIYYTTAGGCSASIDITVAGYIPVGPIISPAAICAAGGIATLLDSLSYTASGTWSSSNTGIATIGTNSGVITGIAVGTTVITFTLSGTCGSRPYVTGIINVITTSAGPIYGPFHVCVGASAIITDSSSGGIWSSSNTSIATINPATGLAYGVTAGTATITYASACTSAYATATLTVNSVLPAAISGYTTICDTGLSGTGEGMTYLYDATSGGTWSSRNTSIATVSSLGVVTGHGIGTDTIYYTTAGGCSASIDITVAGYIPVGPIISPATICAAGGIATLLDSLSYTASGTWSSSNTGVATIGTNSGVITGIAVGTTVITFTLSGTCGSRPYVTGTINVITTSAGPIYGPFHVCVGVSAIITDSSSGGIWSSSNTSIATINPATGLAYGVAAGTATITYASACTSAYATATLTVNSVLPAAISGYTTICDTGLSGTGEGTTYLYDTTSGGTWSSSNTSIATVSSSGVVTGYGIGTDIIYYTTAGGCSASIDITVAGYIPVGPIIAPATICAAGGIATLLDSFSYTASGTWSSSNTGIATIGTNSGVITGIAVGTTVITFTLSGTCGSRPYVTGTIDVISTVSAGAISGTSTVNIGATVSLSDTVAGGAWSSGNTAVATVASSGVVTGVSAGTAVITYAVFGCGTASATYTVTVTAINGISGHVYFSGPGAIKVWLIAYNSSTLMLEAVDSVSLSGSGSTGIYYQFLGEPTDSYRVKAAVFGAGGYLIGTYHTSSYYWYSADVINHISGTDDINEDINMLSWTATTGPGFIGGNVTTGADRGTSTGIPVAGMSVNVMNSTTSQIIQSTVTDISGNYSFSNLPLDNYYVFPDSLNYLTTAYININLTVGADSMTTADFTQHTVSGTITPGITTSVNNVSNIVSSVIAFPNPSNGKLTLQWNEQAAEKGNILVTDIIGREIYKTAINMNEGTGIKQIDLSGLSNGLYIFSVKSGAISYNTKILIQR